jgi:2,4-dichlorophenol 6-monooxygenase
MVDAIDERKAATPEGLRKREALRKAMDLKNYEFNAHGVELGQFYESSAVVADGVARPMPSRDPELYYQPSTVPGSRLPHVWVGDAHRRFSTHDLAPYGQFTLLTGTTGQEWVAAAETVAGELLVPLVAVVIGPGQETTDLYYDWAAIREIEESGAILVRPDKHIGWRAPALPAEPQTALLAAMRAILHLPA